MFVRLAHFRAGMASAVSLVVASTFAQTQTVLLPFDSPSQISSFVLQNTALTIGTTFVTQGTGCGDLTFNPTTGFANVRYQSTTPIDLSGTSGVELDLYNPNVTAVPLGVSFTDAAGKQRSATFSIAPLQPSFIFVSFEGNSLEFGLKEGPAPFYPYKAVRSAPVAGFNMADVRRVTIYMKAPTVQTRVSVDNVQLVGPSSMASRLAGRSDKYGQNALQKFTGKYTSDADFAASIAAEEADLAANPPPADRDAYGGNALGPQLEATGYFRTQFYNNKWWLVTPTGRLYFGYGVNSIVSDNETVVSGREFMFNWLPDATDPLAQFFATAPSGYGYPFTVTTYDFQLANYYRKYGPNYKAAWATQAMRRLASWGVNSIGNGKNRSVTGTPYTIKVHVSGPYQTLNPGWITHEELPDPFDPAFETSVRSAVSAAAAGKASDPYVIGYVVENEPSWAGTGEENGRYGLPLVVLSKNEGLSFAKAAMMTWLQSRYASVSAFNADFGTAATSWTQVGTGIAPVGTLSANAKATLAAFSRFYADKYFSIGKQAVNLAAPSSLYLGCQFSKWTIDVLQSCAAYADAMPIAYYRYTLEQPDADLWLSLGKPIIIAEFGAGAMDRGSIHPGLTAVRFQQDRANHFRTNMTSFLSHPSIVGAYFFKYADTPVTGMAGSGEPYNTGIVSITDEPYSTVRKAIREVSRLIYQVRLP